MTIRIYMTPNATFTHSRHACYEMFPQVTLKPKPKAMKTYYWSQQLYDWLTIDLNLEPVFFGLKHFDMDAFETTEFSSKVPWRYYEHTFADDFDTVMVEEMKDPPGAYILVTDYATAKVKNVVRGHKTLGIPTLGIVTSAQRTVHSPGINENDLAAIRSFVTTVKFKEAQDQSILATGI